MNLRRTVSAVYAASAASHGTYSLGEMSKALLRAELSPSQSAAEAELAVRLFVRWAMSRRFS
jgi:hypothetical protein